MTLPRGFSCFYFLVAAVIAGSGAARAGWPEDSITSCRLKNGLVVVVAVRPELSLAAVNLSVRVGSADDPAGQCGMAHVLEHASLTGSAKVGSLDAARETLRLASLDEAFHTLQREGQNLPPDADRLTELTRRFESARAEANRQAEPGEVYFRRLEERGALGINATTDVDVTQYFCRIPPSEVGFWIECEADRLRHPLFRRFYSERDVVIREIATRAAQPLSPVSLLLQRMFPKASHPSEVWGRPEEVRRIDRPEALRFFRGMYCPQRIVLTVVGKVDPEQVFELCRRHFEGWPASSPIRTAAAVPAEHRSVRVAGAPIASGCLLLMTFPIPAHSHADACALDVVAEWLGNEVLSPLQSELVSCKRLARAVGTIARYPSARCAGHFVIYLYGALGVTPDELADAGGNVLEKLPEAKDESIRGAILRTETAALAQVEDPAMFASQLGLYQNIHGDWRALFDRLRTLRTLKPKAVREAAGKYLKLPQPPQSHEPATQGRCKGGG